LWYEESFTEGGMRSIVPLQVLDVGLQFAETVVAFEDIEIFRRKFTRNP
jgi:hypothetical protein